MFNSMNFEAATSAVGDIQTKVSDISSTLEKIYPKLIDFGGKLLMAIIVYIIGSKVIKFAMKLSDKMMEKSKLDKGVQGFLKSVLKIAPERIVYISCGPESLARDLKLLTAGKKYLVKDIQPVDMFPQTEHVETVALLSKLSEAKHHIEGKVDMDELDLTSAEAKATYKEIQNWVQEKYGFHVTNLNIAQVKQKHGIIERENYNKPKSENSKQPGCQEEKVKAIEDAMRHFQMIS